LAKPREKSIASHQKVQKIAKVQPVPHDKVKSSRAVCASCPHGKVKYSCADCDPFPNAAS
jgi:hypothetical protein